MWKVHTKMNRIKELNRYEEHTRKKSEEGNMWRDKINYKEITKQKLRNNIYKMKYKKGDLRALKCEEHAIYYTDIYEKKNHMCL